MTNPFGKNNGFTLIEALVGNAAGATIIGICYTLFSLYSSSVGAWVPGRQMQMQSLTVAEEIGRNIRTANLVIGPGEYWSANPQLAERSVDTIRLCDTSQTDFTRYQIKEGRLRRWDSQSGVWHDFRIGSRAITLDPESKFRLSADRRSVILNFKLSMDYENREWVSPPFSREYRCRNSS